ncbi:uncharacterized protein LOC108478480 [Gossypium arboreum]|uniref:uncharacterized protein LOC108478480 n=1 Tax=Gossypium arboreum TaxID=29729 RepID=UPI0008195A95|nr:uncharacterized protein LOC108478480 [Gossypium arboreum]
MAPNELAELKTEIQELLDRGLIYPISVKGIQVDPRKIEAVLDWKQSKSVSKICNFLGLIRYYRHFVEGFSLIVVQLTKLLHKGVSFIWTDTQQESFVKLKTVLTLAPVLIQPEPGRDFMVYNDESRVGLGCALMQDNKYHPGKANVVVDALSHRVVTNLREMFARLSLYDKRSLLVELQVKPTWIEQIRAKHLDDKTLEMRFRQVETGTTTDFGLNNDRVLCFRDRICLPNNEDLRLSILREAHRSPYAMHPGGNKMYKDL